MAVITQFLADNVSPALQKNAPFDNTPASGDIITAQLDPGATYHRLYVIATDGGVPVTQAVWINDILKLEFFVNSDLKKVWNKPSSFLYDQAFYMFGRNPNLDAGDDVLVGGVGVLELAPEWMSNPINREIMAYGTKNKNNVSLQITMIGGAITIDKFELVTETTKAKPLGIHITRKESIFTDPATGVIQQNNLTRTDGARVLRLDIIKNDLTAHTINEVSLNIDGVQIYQAVKTSVLNKRSRHLGHYNGYLQNILSLDFTARDREIDALPSIWASFQLEMDVTNALNSYTLALIQEEVDQVVIVPAPPAA